MFSPSLLAFIPFLKFIAPLKSPLEPSACSFHCLLSVSLTLSLCLSLQHSSFSSLYWLKSNQIFLFLHLAPSFSFHLSSCMCVTSSSNGLVTLLAHLYSSVCRQSMQIFSVLKKNPTLLSFSATCNPTTFSLSLIFLPAAACTLSLLAAPT